MTPRETVGQGRTSLSQYYNGSQFRADSWNRLKNILQRLAERREHGNDSEAARHILDQLGPVESYWAFPGHHTFDQHFEIGAAAAAFEREFIIIVAVGLLRRGGEVEFENTVRLEIGFLI